MTLFFAGIAAGAAVGILILMSASLIGIIKIQSSINNLLEK